MSYTSRYCTPSPLFPQPSPTSLERLLWSWEYLRTLDTEGYRTSAAQPLSTWLVDIAWADGRSVRSPGRGTTCSPFTTQAVALAYSASDTPPLRPVLASGQPLSFLFSRATNGTLGKAAQRLMDQYGMTMADNEWPRPVIFFNLGYAIAPTAMRRGDAVHIDWMSGGGHAVFCWDVHLNAQGEVDAFQYVSSNGRIRSNGTAEGAGLGISVGGTPSGSGGFIRQQSATPLHYEVGKTPLFVDDERYVAEAAWVTWNPHLKLADLTGCRTRPRGSLSYARVVKAARFHGVVAPPPFAMSGLPPAAEVGQTTEEHGKRGEVRRLQRQLRLLYAAGLLACDPGEPDGSLGRQSLAALRAFQSAQQLTADGVAGPRTWARLHDCCAQAAATAAGQHYLATGALATSDESAASVAYSCEPAAATVGALYFRHGSAHPGQEVELVLVASGVDGVALPVELRSLRSGRRYPVAMPLCCTAGEARLRLRLPDEVGGWPGEPLVAAIPDLAAETIAPIYVVSCAA